MFTLAKRKIGVLGDTHLGYSGRSSYYGEFDELRTDKTTVNGINIRTLDVNEAFRQAMDIFIEEGVDYVCHTGDGMDDWGYKQPFYYNFYMREVHRLTSEGIKYFEIAGNHNFPKKSNVGSELFKLDLLENVKTIHKGVYESVDIPDTNITIHGLPSTFSNEVYKEELNKVSKKEGRFNILLSHCGITDIEHYAKSESSIVVHIDELRKKEMNLTLLGDYHKFTDFGNHIYYTGATERFSISEANEHPRVLIFEIDDETGEIELKEVFLNVRTMIDLPLIQAKDKRVEEVQNEMIELLSDESVKDAIVRMRIVDLPNTQRHKHILMNSQLNELQNKPLIFKLEFKDSDYSEDLTIERSDVDVTNAFTSFEQFLSEVDEHPDFKKEEVLKYSRKYLKQ